MSDFEYESTLSMLRRKRPRNETDVNADMIDAVLKNILKYQPQHISRENQSASERPDFICYRDDGAIDLIVEGKDLDADLDRRPSRSDPATRIPKIQLDQYLRKRLDSGHGVFGLLSNGFEWRVCRRIENDIVWLSEKEAETKQDLMEALGPLISRVPLKQSIKSSNEEGLKWLGKIIEFPEPVELLEQINPTASEIDQHNGYVASVKINTGSTTGKSSRGCNHLVAMTSMGTDGIISISDVRELLEDTYLTSESDVLAGIATATTVENGKGRCVACRIFVQEDGRLYTSTEFDPDLPGTRVVRQLEGLANWRIGKPNKLLESLSAESIQAEFYDQLANWFCRTGASLNELRHLIRVLFTWFLKEHGYIPQELFEKNRSINIHDQLVHLFTKTLSVHKAERRARNNLSTLKDAFEATPFINGSLFNDDTSELRKFLKDSDYLSTAEDVGLFTILKRYDWTLTEHDYQQSDTALDPSLIGSVFERFIAIAENVKIGKDAKQPLGTYYTPKDITDEMVSDALSYALTAKIKNIKYKDALELVHPKVCNPYVLCKETPARKQTIRKRLRELTVMDPCAGSGQFIVATLNAMRRAERRLLGNAYNDHERIQHAIEKQLFAADIHPIAVQITRLRFYLALVETGIRRPHVTNLSPFPNLETRVTVADSLLTKFLQGKSVLGDLELDSEDVNLWRSIRDEYMFAYTLAEKQTIRKKESEMRKILRSKANFATLDVREWLRHDVLGKSDAVATIGLHLLFGRESWDVVIGNPPYQRLSTEQKNNSPSYGYLTSKCNDLYALFIELGIRLALGKNGIVTMIVPHSICFAKTKETLRKICQANASHIYIRTYNNRPHPVFPPHPYVKGSSQGAENAQRVSVVNILANSDSNAETVVKSSCYIFMPKETRSTVLAARPGTKQPQDQQWTTAGTSLLVTLLERMRTLDNRELPRDTSNRTAIITYPPTARYFITCLPEGLLLGNSRKHLIVPDDKYFWPRNLFIQL